MKLISKDIDTLAEISIIFSFWYDGICKKYSECDDDFEVEYLSELRQNMKKVIELISFTYKQTNDIFMRNECQPYAKPNTLSEVMEVLKINKDVISLIKDMYGFQSPEFIEEDNDIKDILKEVKSYKSFELFSNNR